MPEISKEKIGDIKSDLATFIDLFVHIFRIVTNEYSRKYFNERDFSDKKSYNNPEVFISFAILYVVAKESNFLNKLKYINIAKIRSLFGEDKDITNKIESIILNQGFVSDINKDDVIQEFLKKPTVIQKIIGGNESDFTFFTERLNSSDLINLNKIYFLLQKVVYAKASTKLSPSALIIKEAIMALINRSLSLPSIISVVNWHDNVLTDDEVLKERIKRSIQYFNPTNNIMSLAWDNPFGFISLIYDYKAKDVFQYFFERDGFSKILKTEIGKILKLE